MGFGRADAEVTACVNLGLVLTFQEQLSVRFRRKEGGPEVVQDHLHLPPSLKKLGRSRKEEKPQDPRGSHVTAPRVTNVAPVSLLRGVDRYPVTSSWKLHSSAL